MAKGAGRGNHKNHNGGRPKHNVPSLNELIVSINRQSGILTSLVMGGDFDEAILEAQGLIADMKLVEKHYPER